MNHLTSNVKHHNGQHVNITIRLEEITEESLNNHNNQQRQIRKSSDDQLNSADTANANASSNKLQWEVEDLKNVELLNYLHDWNFPIFQFYEKSSKHVLSQVRKIIALLRDLLLFRFRSLKNAGSNALSYLFFHRYL